MAISLAVPFAGQARADEAAAATDPTEITDEQRDEYSRRLELSPEQIVRVEPILDGASQARRDAMAEYGVDLDADELPNIFMLIRLKFAIDDINKQAEEQLEPILSVSQMRVYLQILQEQSDRMRERLLRF
jgi:hypothetical protein